MAPAAPLMPFLRPLGLPRPQTVRHFLRFSTSSPSQAEKQQRARKPPQEDRNLVASRTASATYPPQHMKSLPRPKESRASRRTSHPPKDRSYPTRQPTHREVASPKLIPGPVAPLPATQCAPNLPYFVTRTPNNELPIYTLRKRGGNMLLTRVKKIDGSVEALRDELSSALGLEKKAVVVNSLTRHVMLKGHRKPEVERFLRERMF